jgi:hypothetical protein
MSISLINTDRERILQECVAALMQGEVGNRIPANCPNPRLVELNRTYYLPECRDKVITSCGGVHSKAPKESSLTKITNPVCDKECGYWGNQNMRAAIIVKDGQVVEINFGFNV